MQPAALADQARTNAEEKVRRQRAWAEAKDKTQSARDPEYEHYFSTEDRSDGAPTFAVKKNTLQENWPQFRKKASDEKKRLSAEAKAVADATAQGELQKQLAGFTQGLHARAQQEKKDRATERDRLADREAVLGQTEELVAAQKEKRLDDRQAAVLRSMAPEEVPSPQLQQELPPSLSPQSPQLSPSSQLQTRSASALDSLQTPLCVRPSMKAVAEEAAQVATDRAVQRWQRSVRSAMPPGSQRAMNAEGYVYYYNTIDGISSWPDEPERVSLDNNLPYQAAQESLATVEEQLVIFQKQCGELVVARFVCRVCETVVRTQQALLRLLCLPYLLHLPYLLTLLTYSAHHT